MTIEENANREQLHFFEDNLAEAGVKAGVKAVDEIPNWPPLKKSLWDVVTAEKLNDGHYVNAYDLTDKLYAAALCNEGDKIDG